MKNFLAILLVIALLTGCSVLDSGGWPYADEAVPTATPSADVSEEVTTLTRVKLRGFITVGTVADYPPYEFYDGDAIIGLDVEAARIIAEGLGCELNVVDYPDLNELYFAVSDGSVDVAMAALNPPESMLADYTVSLPYYVDAPVLVVRAGFDGDPMRVVTFMDSDRLATTLENDLPLASAVFSDSADEMAALLAAGEVDGILCDEFTASLICSDPAFALSDFVADGSMYSCYVVANKDETELISAINDVISADMSHEDMLVYYEYFSNMNAA